MCVYIIYHIYIYIYSTQKFRTMQKKGVNFILFCYKVCNHCYHLVLAVVSFRRDIHTNKYIYICYIHTYIERERERHICNSPPTPLQTSLLKNHDPMRNVPSDKLAWQWKNGPVEDVFPIKNEIFHCHVYWRVTLSESFTFVIFLHQTYRSLPSQALTNCYIGGSQGQKLQKVPFPFQNNHQTSHGKSKGRSPTPQEIGPYFFGIMKITIIP